MQRQIALADHLGECPGIGTIILRFRRCQRAGSGIGCVKGAGRRFHQRQPAGQWISRLGEGRISRHIHDHNQTFRPRGLDGPDEIAQPQTVGWHIDVTVDLGVHARKIVVALILQAVTGEINHHDSICACLRNLVRKVTEGAPEAIAIEITRSHDVEASRLQRLRHQACVVGSCRQRACRIFAVADNQAQALFSAGSECSAGANRDPRQDRNHVSQCCTHPDLVLLPCSAINRSCHYFTSAMHSSPFLRLRLNAS